jgi:N-acetylmuramic acid 6-phosphate etherase
LVQLEEETYRSGHRANYFADRFALDVLTDTTERSPTYCTPPFRKSGDLSAAESWAFLFTPEPSTPRAWERLLKRPARCIDWKAAELAGAGAEAVSRTNQVLGRIRAAELMRYRIGRDGLEDRVPGPGDLAMAILSGDEAGSQLKQGGFVLQQWEAARWVGARCGLIVVGRPFPGIGETSTGATAFLPVQAGRLLLGSMARIGLKLVLNAMSTCPMVRLGRVMGNYMIWVVPSNLKLIDRATRYISKLTGLAYEPANQLLFDVMEYFEPRTKADQACPPAVGLAVTRHRHGCGNREAEEYWVTRHTGADL